MKWYEKFKIGQKVRVVKKIQRWRFNGTGGADWGYDMDGTMNKVYIIIDINSTTGYRLDTHKKFGYNYWYPVKSLQKSVLVGEQLLFSFMEQEE